ncbi:dTDP-4-dehydrorhamnose reductase [Pseudomonas uvaldensis]|uniref:dTDP-4-dehydrorhamnose reductase n=1 Tax=Pseudomonas uvaldensis TaxID=2878385 RepID=UPI001E593C01|nr:dTDP-4-dehydrorhamnose reductase [Pseudomonas uvaldensis]MCE0462829.1 dTDP-4-dehydrorhamnose reductase [Pseudomonas uvaldensis]
MKASLRILIIGQNGQLAQALQSRLADTAELIVRGSGQLDLTRPDDLRSAIPLLGPDLIINAAAHTAVDRAESEPELAFAINATAPGILAETAVTLGVPLIHYSTDYVFDGHKREPYTEEDIPNPLSVYGRSKLAGEEAIRRAAGQHLILRTSWVYSTHGRNFLLTMQRLLQEKPNLQVVADQVGAPTWAATIAESTAKLIERWRVGQPGAWGTYHLTARGETSWYGFAQAIGEHLVEQQKPCAVIDPIPSSAYPTPAHRPLNSRLDCTRLLQEWKVSQPNWRIALHQCLAGQT